MHSEDDEIRIERLERHLAECERAQEALSEVVARQGRQIDRLSQRLALLLEREADCETDEGGVVLGDQRPPHW